METPSWSVVKPWPWRNKTLTIKRYQEELTLLGQRVVVEEELQRETPFHQVYAHFILNHSISLKWDLMHLYVNDKGQVTEEIMHNQEDETEVSKW